jgi:hypothetical protein
MAHNNNTYHPVPNDQPMIGGDDEDTASSNDNQYNLSSTITSSAMAEERMPLTESQADKAAAAVIASAYNEDDEDDEEEEDDDDVDDLQQLPPARQQDARLESSPSPSQQSSTTNSSFNKPGNTTTRFFRSAAAAAARHSSTDGVFANIPAKPDIPATKNDGGNQTGGDDSLPAYESVASDSVPAYNVAVVLPGHSSIEYNGSGDEMIIGGLPIGSMLSFIVCLMTSFFLQLLGFVICYGFGRTHAARSGARAGLGLTFIREAVRLNSLLENDDGGPARDSSRPPQSRIEVLSFIIMVIGWFLFIHAVSDYTRLRRISNSVTRDHQSAQQQQQQTPVAVTVVA